MKRQNGWKINQLGLLAGNNGDIYLYEFTDNFVDFLFKLDNIPLPSPSSFAPEECDGFADAHVIVVEVAKASEGDG